jgi:hypothetical protein
MEIDQRYLADLGYNNAATLFDYYIVQKKRLKAEKNSLQDQEYTGHRRLSDSSEDNYYNEIEHMIWDRYLDLKNNYANHKWQSHCMSKSRNLHEIERLMKEHNLSYPYTNR